VLVSVGGETYANWTELNSTAISEFVRYFRLDGVDIDFEPTAARCRKQDRRIVCDSDATLIHAVKALRNKLPATAILALSMPNVGAFGEGQWHDAQPSGGPYYGLLLALLRDHAVAGLLSYISVMAYDAGPSYQPLQAYRAVRSYYDGPILIGFTSPPEGWGGHVYSTQEAQTVLETALDEGAAGAMLFHLKKVADGTVSPDRPDAKLLAQTLSTTLKRGACAR